MRKQRLLRVTELAKRWSVHRSTVWRWVKIGELPKPRRIGPNVKAWPLSQVKRFERRYLEDAA